MKTSMNHLVHRHSGSRRGFTLIELLIVIGLTAVLFALLLVPLVSAINYTRQAQIVTAAQDAARITRERLTRELGAAMYVFDGTSHPFLVPAGSTTTLSDDRYTNFLDLQIPTSNKDAAGKYLDTVAHAYAAKLDFTLPRSVDNANSVHDPTTTNSTVPNSGDPISYRQSENGSAVVSDPAYVFPLAAGTTMIRYWIGLKDPSKPYNNTHEGKFNDSSDNTYILYRAQFQPYVTKNGVPSANTALFKTRDKLNADGTQAKDKNGAVIQIPELDDPDFFRYVNQNGSLDVNWLDNAHANYPTQDAIGAAGTPGSDAQHNNRVEIWRNIAKPVIPGPNIDLILLPHNTDNTLAYDPAGGAFPGVPHTGLANDPVTGNKYPIVNTSVTFRAATVSGDALPGTTTDYGSAGLPSVSGESGYTYVPTYYTAANRSWTLPFHVSVYPGNYDATKTNGQQVYYDTAISSDTDTAHTPPYVNVGDLLEYRNDTNGRTLVYDLANGYPVTGAPGSYTLGGTNFVPLTVNPDNGTINFGTPSLPNGPTDRNSRNWPYVYNPTADTDKAGGVNPSGVIDLTKPYSSPAAVTDSPLAPPFIAPNNSAATGVKNAHVIPGGIRVYGPDTTVGPNQGQVVPYAEVNSTSDIVGNQYHMDYAANTVRVSPEAVALISPPGSSSKISVVYDYQANLTLTDPTKGFSADNPYLPMQVKVDYQTRDIIDVNIGVRLYDLSSGRAQVIPAQTKIKIGNSNR